MARSKAATPVVVCDAGPIIHLDEIGCLELLADFEEILVPEAVWKEVERHRDSALKSEKVRFQRRKAGAPSIESVALTQLFSLHRGEAEALQLAEALPGCMLLTDDAAARLAASSRKLKVHGTIGILVRSIRRQQRTKKEVLQLLRSIPTLSTLHIRKSLLEEVIRQVEQSD